MKTFIVEEHQLIESLIRKIDLQLFLARTYC